MIRVRNDKRLRILHVVPTYYPAVRYGGTLPAVHGLATALVNRGHDVHVYTTSMDGPGDLDVPLDQPVDLDGVQIHYFRVPALRRLAWSPALQKRLRSSLRSFDVVHLHSIYLWPTAAAAHEARRRRVPYVVSPHGMLVKDIIRRKSRWLKTAWIQLIERRSLAHAAALHVTSDLEASEAREMRLPLPQVITVPNGIDVPETHLPLHSGPWAALPQPYVLFLSRISWKKGLDRLVRAWEQVPQMNLVIAGNDDENYLPTLRAMPEFERVRERITVLGPVSDAHKWALYENALLFVLPSYSENFGYVVAEAMAMACAVIVTPEVGLAGLVHDCDAGVVTDGEPMRLAAAIRALLADPARRIRQGRNGREAVVARLSRQSVAADMEAAYLRFGPRENIPSVLQDL